MRDTIGEQMTAKIHRTHAMLLAATEELDDAQFAQQVSPTVPPIGWHLWHVARWADRLQAVLTTGEGAAGNQIWVEKRLVEQWKLSSGTLGLLEAGAGMSVEQAVSLAQVGKQALLDYARAAFEAVDLAVEDLDVSRLEAPCKDIAEFRVVGGAVEEVPGGETTVVANLMFYLTHANRHLGMIEVLRGFVLGMPGSASI